MCKYIQSLDDNIHIYEDTMPYTIKAFVSPEVDDGYTIYLNKDLSDQTRVQTVEHELRHIKKNDLYSDGSAIDKEMTNI